jgi:hypothetical protein
MALFTDGTPAGLEDLERQESGVQEVAKTEGIDLETKLELGAEETGDEVLDFLLLRPGQDPKAGVRRRVGVSDVVVSRGLRRWHALHTLGLVYRDAYFSHLNDRYRPKWEEYRKRARESREELLRIGIGLVARPLARPGKAVVSSGPGSQGAQLYYVRVAWTGAGGEGAPSAAVAYQTAPGSFLRVEAPEGAPAEATGWNVYVGTTGATFRQNSAPLAMGSVFTLAGAPANGAPAGDGQQADVFVSEQGLR